jgi:polyhydroxyalkanoate synthesis regulator phasin
MKNNKKVAAVVITAVAITGSATALANASGSKMKSVSNTKVTTVSRTFNVNGMGNMGGMRGPAGHVSTVLADLVTKGTITAAESKAVTDAWDALEAAEHAAGATKTPPTTPPTPGQISPELTQALKDLVSKGTLTQAKSDAITAAVKAAEAAEQANRPAMPNGPMGGGFKNSNKEAIITSTLGIDAATLKSRLQAGDSLATIAGAKKDALIAALVADETKQIDAAVTAGKLTAAQATTIKADLTAHVTAEVNATGPMGGFGGKGGHGHGGPGGHGGGMGMPNGSKNGIPSTTTTSTTAN